jgi:vancomycin permeability regulator SanA
MAQNFSLAYTFGNYRYVKMQLDLIFGKKPKFLGEKIIIE